MGEPHRLARRVFEREKRQRITDFDHSIHDAGRAQVSGGAVHDRAPIRGNTIVAGGGSLRMVDPNVAFTAVRASRGKVVRAEPVAALYQQGRVHHIGTFPQLEDQMTNFTSDIDRAAAGYSPDRVDALVWAFTELLVERMPGEGIFE